MSTFVQYAQFYDLLYKDKNYLEEQTYIKWLCDKNHGCTKSILDLGCGTGIHAKYFSEDGCHVHGVDKSKDMLRIANKRKSKLPKDISSRLKFSKGDIRNIRLEEKFDVVTSLFHVLSYQINDKDVLDSFSTAKCHLNSDGLFIFDFWYGPGVEKNTPEKKARAITRGDLNVERFTVPVLNVENNTVEVNFTIHAHENGKSGQKKIEEQHLMRYFFRKELEVLLKKSGMKIVNMYSWMTDKAVSDDCWSAVIVAKSYN